MKITYEQEIKLCKAMLMQVGLPEEDAQVLSEVTAHSDFTGVYSHGLSRFADYVKHFKNGMYNAHADMKVTEKEKAFVKFDADNGSGVVGINKLYDELLPIARENGIAIGTANHGTNIGCGSYYAMRAVKDNVIGIFVCNCVCAMAPFGGAEKLLGTNPIIVGVPAGEEKPIILDLATSNVAMGKVQAYAREGKPIPEDWALDKEGRPTTDAKAAYAVRPFGAHKGYGLAIIVDMLSSMLSGANYARQIGAPRFGTIEGTGFAVILIDIEKFRPIDEFKAAVDDYIRTIKGSKKAEGCKEIFMPGEIEFSIYESNMKNGVDVPDGLSGDLAAVAAMIGLVPEGTSYEQLMSSL